MKVTVKKEQHNVNVTARAVMLFEKESKKTIQELMTEIGEGKLPSIETIAMLLKASTKLDFDSCLAAIDENDNVYMDVITAYSTWVGKAFAIAETGNSEAPTTA
jgi:hypothetical protein